MTWIKEHKFLLLIILIGAALRLYRLDYQSAWLDELHTINEANPDKSFSGVYDALMTSEALPPLFFWIVNVFFKLFGYSIFVARIFSALAGIAGIYAIYCLGRELWDKKVGYYAAILLTVNYFHLYYSQEARPYAFLLLTTILSFLYLVKFLKMPSLKSALVWGVFSALMLYAHFFAFFVMVSQSLIVLFFVAKPNNTTRKRFFFHALFGGLLSLLLYVPAYKLLLKTTEITSIWIPMPSADVYTQFFKDFFGQSELVIFFAVILVVFFFLTLFKFDRSEELTLSPEQNKNTFNSIILLLWIFATLLVPLIRTYTNLPMLVNRYFINVLPAVILVIAVGLSYVRNKTARYAVLSLFLVFSFTDILVVKRYYSAITKTQFREVSNFILDKNKNKDLVVSNLSWYYSYFLKSGEVNMRDSSLDNFVNEMMLDSTNLKSFWYTSGHINNYNLGKDKEDFLQRHFTIDENVDMFDCWARHYEIGVSPIRSIDMSAFKNPLVSDGVHFMSNIEKFEFANNTIQVVGWAFFSDHSSECADYDVVLINSAGTAYKLNKLRIFRPDNTTYFKKNFDAANSGFSVYQDISGLPLGEYKMAIYIVDRKTGEKGLQVTDKTVVRQ